MALEFKAAPEPFGAYYVCMQTGETHACCGQYTLYGMCATLQVNLPLRRREAKDQLRELCSDFVKVRFLPLLHEAGPEHAT